MLKGRKIQLLNYTQQQGININNLCLIVFYFVYHHIQQYYN